ncbi:MAG: nitrite/sulfite reductase [Myxococcales bacterium]|nr:nitrite/sulfite reductase [Myxococcales bacterium]
MAPPASWKEALGPRVREDWGREIDVFETQLELRQKGKLEEKLFAETRLRRGAYGQRYDNGQRNDGKQTQPIAFPERPTKGPGTAWDAPGMMRIKIPYGKLTAEQLSVMAELAEEYSDGILHVTTRQDIQLHFVHLEDTPDLMRRLAATGITTREACGNSVRNVTQCPDAGVCAGEAFDTTPYAHALTFFLLGHDDTQDFGRKFKIAFSGCRESACGLVSFHDIGAVAATRVVEGRLERGFQLFVGGGLGSVPQAAALLEEFTPEAELLPVSQAICRVFGRLGERDNRQRARLKFLVKRLGIEEFRRLVREERNELRPDPRWTEFLSDLQATDESPLRPAQALFDAAAAKAGRAFATWRASNVRSQKQQGYSTAVVALPLGDLTSRQARAVAELARRYTGDTLRATVDQNLLLRWVSDADLPLVHAALESAGLGEAGAGTITDITACPGTDTCKLGISSSRGLAGELRKRLMVVQEPAAKSLHVKCSGCFNSCGQHHVADIGFLGVSRVVNGRRVPHFQLVVGGQWTENAGAFGLAIGAVPSKNVPKLLDVLKDRYVSERQADETFRAWTQRIGKKAIRALVDAHNAVPAYDVDPSYYSDWGDPREYTIGDIGEGECAGAVVSFLEMGLAGSEREVFEAQLLLDGGDAAAAAGRARSAMLLAARALAREKSPNVSEEPEEVVREFRAHFYDTKLFFDPFAGGKFAHYLFKAHAERAETATSEAAHQLIEEAQLFVDAAHACHARLVEASGVVAAE